MFKVFFWFLYVIDYNPYTASKTVFETKFINAIRSVNITEAIRTILVLSSNCPNVGHVT